jgi:hypothetical protein
LWHFDEHHTCIHHVLLLLLELEEDVGTSCLRVPELDVEVLDIGATLLELDEEVLDVGRRARSARAQGGGGVQATRSGVERSSCETAKMKNLVSCTLLTENNRSGSSMATCGKNTIAVGKFQNLRQRLNENEIPHGGM